MSNVHYLPSYEPPAPQDEPLPTRAELADLVAHDCMTPEDAAGYPVTPDPGRAEPQSAHHPIWGVLTLVFASIAIEMLLV